MTIPRTWARTDLLAAVRWCAIDSIDHGRVAPVCSIGWPTSSTAAIHQNPPLAERCKACERGAVDVTEQIFVMESALNESDVNAYEPMFRATPTVSGRRVVAEWDLSDSSEWGEG